jgi:hypothetical protein
MVLLLSPSSDRVFLIYQPSLHLSTRQRVFMRSAPTYPKQPPLRAFGPKTAFGIRDWKLPSAGFNALRASIPEAGFQALPLGRKQHVAYASASDLCFVFSVFGRILLRKTGLCGGSAAMHGLRPCAAAAPRPFNPIARHQLRQTRQRLRLPELMKKLYPGKMLIAPNC